MSTREQTTREQTYRNVVETLFPFTPEGSALSNDVPGDRIAAMLLFVTREDVLLKVFPSPGVIDPEILYREFGLDRSKVTEGHLAELVPFLDALLAAHLGWMAFGGYTDPPCPDGFGRRGSSRPFSRCEGRPSRTGQAVTSTVADNSRRNGSPRCDGR